MHSHKPQMLICISIIWGLMTSHAFAGSASVSGIAGDAAQFEYNGNMLRINATQNSGYALLRDGHFYTVGYNNGQAMVFDAGAMLKGFSDMAPQAIHGDLGAEIVSLEDTGEKEIVAGIQGHVYTVTFIDDSGQERGESLVLSTDIRALEFRDAMFQMMSFAQTMTPGQDKAKAQGQDIRERLNRLKAGILRYGKEMTVTEISGETVANERFELPAKPLDLQGLGKLFGQ
ncbi:hypothetical protein R0135_05205 [Congregibacter variabilis]|uniref:DUF4412 domain-containing protein n=1 Tax=Congregibacter variabilis TaxID=3081200 RepID=A0ABZ0I691_9GAMM|nr:hypothetical protein R0135_05205 [Congregibacter sp. IMCC43200]